MALFYDLCHIQKITELSDLKISLLGKELLPVPSGKELGVILDNNLTYHDHITKTVSSFFSRLDSTRLDSTQINRVQQAFNNKILINIIYKLYLVNYYIVRTCGQILLTEICVSYNLVKLCMLYYQRGENYDHIS